MGFYVVFGDSTDHRHGAMDPDLAFGGSVVPDIIMASGGSTAEDIRIASGCGLDEGHPHGVRW